MAPNQLLIGKSAFIVRAQSLPNGYNQRPGMTLLLADGEPLELEIDGLPAATSEAWLLAPEIRRRFLRPQPHTSITVEPSHPSYLRMLRWARSSPDAALRVDVPVASRFRLASATTQQTFDDALNELLALHEQPEITPSPRLEYLLSLVEASGEDSTAEQIWGAFRSRYSSTQAHCSHWLQESLGLPLRKLLLWRKLRRALEGLNDPNGATAVAHEAGFADSAHPSRICLRTFGLRPSQANNNKILQVSWLQDC